MATPSPVVGNAPPDFSVAGLRLVDGEVQTQTYSLAGRPVGSGPLVIAFYPGDETPVCTRQMCSYSSGLDGFLDLGAEVWGVSPQDLASHEKFARRHELRMPLLADTDKAMCRAFGVLRLGGLHVARSVFVVDSTGVLRWRHISTLGVTYQDTGTLAGVVRELVGAS